MESLITDALLCVALAEAAALDAARRLASGARPVLFTATPPRTEIALAVPAALAAWTPVEPASSEKLSRNEPKAMYMHQAV